MPCLLSTSVWRLVAVGGEFILGGIRQEEAGPLRRAAHDAGWRVRDEARDEGWWAVRLEATDGG